MKKSPTIQSKVVSEICYSEEVEIVEDQKDIRHVGMYIGDNQFIPSSPSELKPFIHISSLSDSEWDGKPERHFAYRAARSLKNHLLTKRPL